MKFLVKVSFAGTDVTGQAGKVIDLPADSKYARFCEPIEEPEAEQAPAPKPKPKKAK
jgi:hypothetical protein